MNYYQSFISKAPLFNATGRVASLMYLEPVTRNAVLAILKDAQDQGIPLLVFETYRSQARQTMLFEQGKTELKTVGTHQFGIAADIVKNAGNGVPSWDGDFSFLAPLAQKYGLISGLNWGHVGQHNSFVDACHVQRIRVEDQSKLFAGNWWPDDDYNPYKSTQVA